MSRISSDWRNRTNQTIRSNTAFGNQNGYLILSFALFTAGLFLFVIINSFHAYKFQLFISGFALTFAGMLALRHFWPAKWNLLPVLVVAVLARSIFIPLAPSDDLNRYLWEGKIQLYGMSPYAVAPADSRTEPFRDAIWHKINHREYTTIYGPVAQIVFRICAATWYSPSGMKLILLIFDMGTLILIAMFLKRRGSRINEALLYAINPLVLYSFAAEGHLECMMLFMLAAAMLLYQRKRFGWMFGLLGCAVAVKLTSLMFVPLFIRKDTVKQLPFIVIPAVLALPYISSIQSLLTITLKFGTEIRFNGCSYGLMASFFSDGASRLLSFAIFIVAYTWNFFLTPDPVKASGNVAVAFLLTSPIAHPWYFTIVAMYASLYPARSWIALSATIGISWIVSFRYWLTGIWKEQFDHLFIEYGPPFLIELFGRWLWPGFVSIDREAPKSVSIVIPVLNESDRLRDCLRSIQLPSGLHTEIIVVDGGSSDATPGVAAADSRVRLIRCGKGRGIQIARGVEQASGDLIIVLHADSRLERDSIDRILRFSSRYPHVAGGSVASRFESPGLRYAFITMLNNFRSRFSGISFGDQVQFFRRESLSVDIPRVKIMEDIEISMQLKERGVIAVLPSIAKSSTRRWAKRSYGQNMFMVISLTTLYLIKRRFGLLSEDNAEFYEVYYGKA